MTPVNIGWIDGLNAAVRPITSIVFLLLFAVGIISYSFGMITNDAFGATLTGLFNEAMMGVLGFMFGNRAVRTVVK